MSAREHLSLRAASLLLLAIVALWPRSHAGHAPEDQDHHPDRAVAAQVIRGHFETAGARPSAEGVPRPRSARLLVVEPEETSLTN